MKILTTSDSPNLCSGLARVHRHVIDGLVAAGHSVLPCVWFGYDKTTTDRIKKKEIAPPPLTYKTPAGDDIQMLTIPKRSNFDEVKMLYDICKMVKPDVVLTTGDFWDFYYIKLLKSKLDFNFKWVAYLTIERDQFDKDLTSVIKYADALAAPTLFGQKLLQDATGETVEFIPYGMDDRFKRLPDKERARLKEERGCTGKTRFITVGQNTWRKNLPCLLQAIDILADRNQMQDKHFYIHTNVDAADAQEMSLYDLRAIVEYLGLEKYVSFPKQEVSLFKAPDDDVLVQEYNASDIFVLPSVCEGYGLPFHEAMACGLPVICSNWSVMPETVGSADVLGFHPRGWLVNTRLEFVPPARPVQMPTPEALANTIQYAAGQVVPAMREECTKFAKERRWEETKRKVCDIVEQAASRPDRIPVEEV